MNLKQDSEELIPELSKPKAGSDHHPHWLPKQCKPTAWVIQEIDLTHVAKREQGTANGTNGPSQATPLSLHASEVGPTGATVPVPSHDISD